jgi:chromosome segregation ATPase
MDNENRRLAEMSDGGYAQKQEQCEQAANRAIAARKEYEEHQPGFTSLHEDVKTASKNMETAKMQCDSKKNDVTQAENRLRALTREDGQRKDGFPDKMPALKRAIQQESSFTSKPIGPIGDHITLLKPKWSSILEYSFGGTLSSFIVSNKRDMSILSNLMAKVNWYVSTASYAMRYIKYI